MSNQSQYATLPGGADQLVHLGGTALAGSYYPGYPGNEFEPAEPAELAPLYVLIDGLWAPLLADELPPALNARIHELFTAPG